VPLDFTTAGGIVERWNALRRARSTFETLWQEVADHVTGFRSFTTRFTPGQKRTQHIYDTTALTAGNQLAGVFHGVLTNPAARWFFLDAEPATASFDSDAKAWMDLTDAAMQHVFRRGRFGFIPAIAETYRDDVFFGTSDIYVEDVPGTGPVFRTIPLSELYIDENDSGMVDLFFRCQDMTLRQAAQRFGMDALPDSMKRRYEKSPEDTTKVLSVTFEKGAAQTKARVPHPWVQIEVLVEEKKIVRERGYWSRPHHVSRMNKDTGELYGRCPAIFALSDARMLNEMKKTRLKASQKNVDPPLLTVHEGILTQLDTSPGSNTIVEAFSLSNGNRPVIPLYERGVINGSLTSEDIQDTQRSVREHFLGDALAAQLQQYMTATQTIEISEIVAQRLLSQISRIQVEKIEPMLLRTLDIVERGGLVPRRPQSLRGVQVVPRFLSPVERVQRASEARAVLQTWTSAAQIAPVHPEVFDNYDPDATARLFGDLHGVPPTVLRSVEERDELREVRAQREEAAAQQQQFMEGVDAASKFLPALAKVQGAPAAAA